MEHEQSSDSEPCETCNGAGWMRLERPVGDPEFGQLVRCPTCGGTRNAERLARVAERISRECGLSDPMRAMTFRDYEPYTGTQEALRAAQAFAERGIGQGMWLVISGDRGRGKTHLLAAIANQAIARGIPTVYSYVTDLLDHLRAGYNTRDGEENEYGNFDDRWDRLKAVRLLLLDDLGVQSRSSWVTERLEALIDARYREHLPMAITTNLDRAAIARLSERVEDRLDRYEPSVRVAINALSYREWKRQHRQAAGE